MFVLIAVFKKRILGIPVRYFGSASAKKCAVQLALDELAAEKRQDEV